MHVSSLPILSQPNQSDTSKIEEPDTIAETHLNAGTDGGDGDGGDGDGGGDEGE